MVVVDRQIDGRGFSVGWCGAVRIRGAEDGRERGKLEKWMAYQRLVQQQIEPRPAVCSTDRWLEWQQPA